MTILVGTASWADKSLVDSGQVLSARGHQPRGAASLLRLAVPDGRGRLELLRHAGPGDDPAMGRAHARALRLQRQGVSALHRPPGAAACPSQGPPGSAREAAPRERLLPGPARGDTEGALGPLLRRLAAPPCGRQARRDPLPVRAVDHVGRRASQARRALRPRHGRHDRWRWSFGTPPGGTSATASRPWRSSASTGSSTSWSMALRLATACPRLGGDVAEAGRSSACTAATTRPGTAKG